MHPIYEYEGRNLYILTGTSAQEYAWGHLFTKEQAEAKQVNS
jgi:hypothetical protein